MLLCQCYKDFVSQCLPVSTRIICFGTRRSQVRILLPRPTQDTRNKLRHPPGQLRGYSPPGSGPARSRSCRLNSHSKLSGSFSITPTASPRASRAFQIDNGVESIASDDQPVVLGDGTSGRRKANPGMAPNVTASSVRQTQSIEATILMPNQASYVALQPAICDGSEGGEREGTQQVQSRRIRGAG